MQCVKRTSYSLRKSHWICGKLKFPTRKCSETFYIMTQPKEKEKRKKEKRN
jgi:hypothetical protein